MLVDSETLAIIILGFFGVILLSLIVIITLWVKNKSKAYSWFLIQVILLIIAFINFIKLLFISSYSPSTMTSREYSLSLGIITALWALSILSMIIGISMLNNEKKREEFSAWGKKEYDPNFKRGLGIVALYIFLFSLIPQIIVIIVSKFLRFSYADPLGDVFTTIAALGILILWLKRKYIINFKSLFSMEKFSAIFLIPMILSILGSVILFSEVDNFMLRVFPMNDIWIKAFNTLFGNGFATWKTIISVAIVGPIVEEIIFRGLILRGLLKHYSAKKAIILSALLFGIAHMNPWQGVSAFVFGIIMGWWYVKTDSIIPTIFGHALNNSMGFIVSAVVISVPGFSDAYNTTWHQPVWFDLLGVVLLSLGIIWLIKLFSIRQAGPERTIINAEGSN